MVDYREVQDVAGRTVALETRYRGSALLEAPMLNKGTAFTEEERDDLGLRGLLPPHINTLDDQIQRRYEDFCAKSTDLEKHIFLRAIQDRNETLFYALLTRYVEEMMPIVYTPTVGAACQMFSHIFRKPRGLFISYPERDRIAQILANRPYQDVDVIVVTDGERILGLGDQGAGGMGIPIGKLSLYTACGGINPARTLPITLDVGTNNPERLRDPLYLGWQHERIRGSEYDAFVDRFVKEVKRQLPGALLQWEDFANPQAFPLLDRYRGEICSFNDDIQGTAAVTLAALLSALRQTGKPLRDQRIVLLGAGSAGAGICQLVLNEMTAQGMSDHEARRCFWSIDSKGLVYRGRAEQGLGEVGAIKEPWARNADEVGSWTRNATGQIELLEVVRKVKPTILIGVSAQPGSFSREVVTAMAANCDRPVILPLSNPTSKIEAHPKDLLEWTEGRAVIATGSPIKPITYGGRSYTIGQCNNSYIFPGVGLGVLAARAKRVTDGMFQAAARALAQTVPVSREPGASLLPRLTEIRPVSMAVAQAVAAAAMQDGVAERLTPEATRAAIEAIWWEPKYLPIRSRPDLPPGRLSL